MPNCSNETKMQLNKPLAFKLDKVTAGYGKNLIFEDINLSINKGTFLYVVGPNGSGKSTLVKLLTKRLKPFSGSVELNFDNIGFLPQYISKGFHFPISVKEVIYSGFNKQSLFISRDDEKEIVKWLEKMEIPDVLNKKISELSGGQQQRVLLIRTLISNPNLIILDEPTSALDPDFKTKFYEIIYGLHKEGKTVVFITHDLHEVLRPSCKIIRINHGIEYFGTVEGYKNEFIGDSHAF